MEKTIITPIIKNIIFFLFIDNVFLSDFTIKGMDAIINPRNKEFISYMLFSKIEVINNTDNIKPAIHPIPILDKNFKALILPILSPDIMLFNELKNNIDYEKLNTYKNDVDKIVELILA